ncbi:MAG: P1 family peptidase [Acidobacteria bacterium]|nr:P1 family peptidase [Acidobacteriota bacterium]
MKKSTAQSKRLIKSSITEVSGIRVGHADNREARTGCTVILCEAEGAVCGVDVRGAAPGTRETDLLDPTNLVERVHALVFAGGSAYGLDAASGVMKFLEERGIGFNTPVARVPIVPAAVIFDLAIGDAHLRPDAAMGYQACVKASNEGVEEGQVGAGAGAMVGKILGMDFASNGGLATASMKLANGISVGVLVVVNAFGDIVDPASGKILAGARKPKGRGFLDTQRALTQGLTQAPTKAKAKTPAFQHPFQAALSNTTLAVVATDAALTKAQARKVAGMAHDGLARAIRPIHTMFDGDTIFALSTGELVADVTTIGAAAAELMATAVVRVVTRVK